MGWGRCTKVMGSEPPHQPLSARAGCVALWVHHAQRLLCHVHQPLEVARSLPRSLLSVRTSLVTGSLSLSRPITVPQASKPRGTVLYSWALSLSHEFHPQSLLLGRDQGFRGMRPIAILLHPPRDERRKHSMCRSTRHNQSILWILVLDLVVRLLCLHEHHDATRVPTAIAEPGPFVHLLR